MDEIGSGEPDHGSIEPDARGRLRTAFGLAATLAIIAGLVIWQRQGPTVAHRGTAAGRRPTATVALAGDFGWTVTGSSFRAGFMMRNVGDASADLTDVHIDVPASFHNVSVGVLASDDENDVFDTRMSLLDEYTLPVQAAAFVVVAGAVICPAGDMSRAPKVTMRVNGVLMSFDPPSSGTGNWQSDVVTDACHAKS